MSDPAPSPSSHLAAGLSAVLGVEVRDLTRLTGGASRETWSFKADIDGVASDLILRRDPPGAIRTGGMGTEALLFNAAAAAGVPVPRLRRSGDGSDGVETGYLIMDRVGGETIARKLLRDEPYAHARSVLVSQLGRALAAIHTISPSAAPELLPSDELATYRTRADELKEAVGLVSPAFELAFRWLEQNRPEPSGPPTVVHGDFRLGNVIVDESGLAAVLDWEIAHIGDPLEDLGWLSVRAWRFGGPGVVAGMGDPETLIAAYEAAGGRHVDRAAYHWWLVLGTLKWGIMCGSQAGAHLTGVIRSVELAAIGRRVAEQEHDIMELLGYATEHRRGSSSPSEDSAPVAAVDLHRLPNAQELLEAVREYLERDVMPVPGRVGFHARVAANVVAMIERELRLGPAQRYRYAELLKGLGVVDDGELAAAIRQGAMDSRRDEVARVVRFGVDARLEVANPKHFG